MLHIHKYVTPSMKDIWEKVHTEIFVEGNMFSNVTTTCKCGATKEIKAFIRIHIER